MKKMIQFVVLAVTKTYDKYCIAGMDQSGKWMRPLPVGTERFWSSINYSFRNFMDRSTYDGKLKPRITFSHKGIQYNNTTTSTTGFPITDLKWLAYTQRQISTHNEWHSLFICVGLARTEPKKGFDREYPMIISVITDPEVPLLSTYPN